MSSLRSVIIVAAEPFFLIHLGSRKKVTPAPARAAKTNPRKKKPAPTPPPAVVSPLPTALPSPPVAVLPVSSGRDGVGAKDARPCVRREFEHFPLGSYLGEDGGCVVSISSIHQYLEYDPDETIFV